MSSAAASRVVLGRYAIGPVLGRGATAVVHRARDLRSGEEVAVKAIPLELGLAPRVRSEIKAAGRLSHPRVVPLRDVGEDEDCLYLVWELVEGRSLAAILRERARPGDALMLRLGEDLLAALAHAHANGVVHRDVKPANVLVDGRGRGLLTDFGVARLSGEATVTAIGDLVGTIAYMAPEQARGDTAQSPADVYAACLVIYEGLTGGNPIKARSPALTARRASEGAIEPLMRVRGDLPERLCKIVQSGLRRDPARRPSAADLAAELAMARGGLAAAGRRGLRALPALGSAAGGTALGALAATHLDGTRLASWEGPGATALAMALGAALFAWRPRAAALIASVAGAALVGAHSAGAGMLLGALALALLAAGWPSGRLTLLPAAAPALFALGLGLLYPALAGLVAKTGQRIWAAVAGVVAALAWQVGAGTSGLVAGSGYVAPGIADLEGENSPAEAARRLWEPLGDRPEALVQGLVLVAAALWVPAVLRAREGGPRLVAAVVWVSATAALLAIVSGATDSALAAVLPAAVVILAWAIAPWRELSRRVAARASATLRNPSPWD